jgi:hypothetical protein
VDFADAVAIAARAYGDRRDRSGLLLIAHGVEVAQGLGRNASPIALNAAVLHDVLEDTDWTIDDLANRGVDAVVCEAVDALTRRSGESYMGYIERICAATGLVGDTARLVKVADLRVNFARADSDALRERYERSLPLVQNALTSVA